MNIELSSISSYLFKNKELVGSRTPSDQWGSHTQNLWMLAQLFERKHLVLDVPSPATLSSTADAIEQGLPTWSLSEMDEKVVQRGIESLRWFGKLKPALTLGESSEHA